MKITGTNQRPRVVVNKSNKYLFTQIIDDSKGVTIASVRGLKNSAEKIGEELGKIALSKKIKKVVFDRNGYVYHGKVKLLADTLRKVGLEF